MTVSHQQSKLPFYSSSFNKIIVISIIFIKMAEKSFVSIYIFLSPFYHLDHGSCTD